MEKVRWKPEHIIKEIQDELDPDPEEILKEAEAEKEKMQREKTTIKANPKVIVP